MPVHVSRVTATRTGAAQLSASTSGDSREEHAILNKLIDSSLLGLARKS